MNELKKQAPSRNEEFADTVARLTRPLSMDAERYIYGTEVVNGHDAWTIFNACEAGDLARVQTLAERDPALVNSQHWYQFPLHMAAREGYTDVVQFLLEHGADLEKSRYLYNSWDKLLSEIERRGHLEVRKLIEAAFKERFNYHPSFNAVREAIKARYGDAFKDLKSRTRHRVRCPRQHRSPLGCPHTTDSAHRSIPRTRGIYRSQTRRRSDPNHAFSQWRLLAPLVGPQLLARML